MAKPRLHMEEVVANVVKILFSIVLVFVGLTIAVSLFRVKQLYPCFLSADFIGNSCSCRNARNVTVSIAKGSQQLAAKGILVSRLSATEDAATLTTLCIDKQEPLHKINCQYRI